MNDKKAISLSDLEARVEALEQGQTRQIEALKMLLPLALAIPASTNSSGLAVKELKQALAAIEEGKPQSEDFWYLASAMALLLSSKALTQHPKDPEVNAIYQGLRAHRQS